MTWRPKTRPYGPCSTMKACQIYLSTRNSPNIWRKHVLSMYALSANWSATANELASHAFFRAASCTIYCCTLLFENISSNTSTDRETNPRCDVCKTVLLFMRMRIVITRLTYIHSSPPRSEVSSWCQFKVEYIQRLHFSTVLILSVRNPKFLSRIALLPLERQRFSPKHWNNFWHEPFVAVN